jgi:hypothetical protein
MRTHETDGELAYAKELLESAGYLVVFKQELRDFGPIKGAIFDYVRRNNGVTLVQIYDHVWGSDRNGGPETLGTLRCHLSQMNKQLRKEGMCIASKGGWHKTYHLVQTDEAVTQ